MAEPAASSPCGCCGHPVPAGANHCSRCGIRLIDLTRHRPGYKAKEFLLDSLDAARNGIRNVDPRKVAGMAVGGALMGAAIVGYRLLRRRGD